MLGRSLASFQALLWYGRFCLLLTCTFRAGIPNLGILPGILLYMGLWAMLHALTLTPRVFLCALVRGILTALSLLHPMMDTTFPTWPGPPVGTDINHTQGRRH